VGVLAPAILVGVVLALDTSGSFRSDHLDQTDLSMATNCSTNFLLIRNE
jgi:hypothetical protein